MSGIKFTRKESRVLIDLVSDLKNTGFSSKNLKILEKKVNRFEDDRTKECLNCGQKFVSTRMTKVYCSRKCQKIDWSEHKEICGNKKIKYSHNLFLKL